MQTQILGHFATTDALPCHTDLDHAPRECVRTAFLLRLAYSSPDLDHDGRRYLTAA